MECRYIDVRKAVLILLCVLINEVHYSKMADNHMDLTTKALKMDEPSYTANELISDLVFVKDLCMKKEETSCSQFHPLCIECNFDKSCIYGKNITVDCRVSYKCKGPKTFKKDMMCRYCYQTNPCEHKCEMKANCNSIGSSRSPYTTNCTVNDDVICLGYRTFNKNVPCNWTGGHRWSTALLLSITLGGFGADRFYLGHWQEGIGKLFSFGGLGVWTLIDVILISLRYLGPADGSLYI